MTITKHELLADRLARILIHLYQGAVLTKEQLAEEFNVTTRTIYRDLGRLGPILDVNPNGSYRLATQYKGKLSPNDLQQFASIAGVKNLFPNNDPRFLLALLDTMTGGSYLVKGMHYEDNIDSKELMSKIDSSISSHHECQFEYNQRTRIVKPYKIINSKGIWYLAGIEGNDLKSFNISKIDNFKKLEKEFIPEDSIVEQVQKEDGIWFSQDKTEVILNVSKHASYYFSRRILFPHQEIIKNLDDGGLLISCKVGTHKQLFPLVQYWMPHVSIVNPTSWHHQLLANIKSYMDKN